MQTGLCTCGARLFFQNTRCLGCGKEVGICATCRAFVSFDADDKEDKLFPCESCNTQLAVCSNRKRCACNVTVERSLQGSVCNWCSLSTVVPDLDNEQNVAHWTVLEGAKRKLLNQLEQLKLPPYSEYAPPVVLSFQFLSDYQDSEGNIQRVFTGHQDGVITINLQEADSVYREKMRVEFGEPQRTLIGHLRHEYGHYLDLCIPEEKRGMYIEQFGDPTAVDYDVARSEYYEKGPDPEWKAKFASAYATMHPWEDFAETTNLYLDMQAILRTARDSGWLGESTSTSDIPIEELVAESLEIAVTVSELNGDLGLPSLLPENVPNPVLEKLRFVHELTNEFALTAS